MVSTTAAALRRAYEAESGPGVVLTGVKEKNDPVGCYAKQVRDIRGCRQRVKDSARAVENGSVDKVDDNAYYHWIPRETDRRTTLKKSQ